MLCGRPDNLLLFEKNLSKNDKKLLHLNNRRAIMQMSESIGGAN